MRMNQMKAIFKNAVRGAAVLLMGAGLAQAQQVVNLTAGASLATLPDGASVHMWGYTCGATVSGSTATCTNMKTSGWSPVVITVPTGQGLEIDLTNNLIFNGNKIPTSIVIVGQLGGGLGDISQRTTTKSPVHDNQGTSWPIANTGPTFTPPQQADRVQSFSAEVPAGNTTAAKLTWTAPAPGTYLLESGTHPSIQAAMGLIGMVVVTEAPSGGTAGSAYPGVSYNAEVPLLFSEIDPAQNNAVDVAVNTTGFVEAATRNYLTGGGVASINLTSGGSGYTKPPTVKFSPTGAVATAQIDTDSTSPTFGQVTEIDIDPNQTGNYTSAPSISITPATGDTTGSGATATAALALASNASNACQYSLSGGITQAAACYPPVVNYSPRYYLINGQAFDPTNKDMSRFAAAPGNSTSPITGNVLVRMVNAGLRMHVPSIVGSQIGTGSNPPSGFALIAEDGNVLPGVPRVQSEVFMAAGKTYDVMINVPGSGSLALPVFDRELSLSANSTNRNTGMLAYISVNGANLPNAAGTGAATANNDEYDAVVTGQTLTVSDPAKGVIANDVNIFGVKIQGTAPAGLTLYEDGTFTYTGGTPTTFNYCGNGATSGAACAKVTLATSTVLSGDSINVCPIPTGSNVSTCTFNSNLAKVFKVSAPGLLSGAADSKGLPLTVDLSTITASKCASSGAPAAPCIVPEANGGFTFYSNGPGDQSFSFQAVNSLGLHSGTANATVHFTKGSGLSVTVLDGTDKTTKISDYRWIIEEDRTFFVDPACALNPGGSDSSGQACPTKVVNFGTNFHSSFMPMIASGCTGDISCGNNQSVQNVAVAQKLPSMPGDIPLCSDLPTGVTGVGCLDPTKRYYLSVLPGDAAQPFIGGSGDAPSGCSANTGSTLNDAKNWTTTCGHGMGGAPIAKGFQYGTQPVTVLTEPSPYPPATLTVFVFEDDFPLNGEHDAGGGVDILSPNEPGLGGFQITLQDDAGGTGDATGTPTYDMFNMPLSNSLAGTVDPITGADACPLSAQTTDNLINGDGSQKGIVGMIITCPKYESDGVTLSPLAGQAVVKNLYQGRYGVVAQPGADRFARGEEWLQTNTLDGQKAHDSFMRIGEPAYFQEFGPAGYHVTIGFANPKIINDRLNNTSKTGICDARSPNPDCTHDVKGHITTARMSRTPDERLYGSGTHDEYAFTQCYVSLGDPDGEEIAFQKCNADGFFDFKNIPPGNWKITTFDQWNDQVVDGITTPTGLCDSSVNPVSGQTTLSNCKKTVDMGEVAVHQWQSDIYTRTFLDTNYTGVSDDSKPGLPLVATNIRFRDGSYSNFNSTDLNGFAGFNEVFPLFNWYVIETDSTRYKNSGTHVVYDSGGPADGSLSICPATDGPSWFTPAPGTGAKQCGTSAIAQFMANTYEPYPLPAELSLPGSVYCADADCSNEINPTTPGGAAGIAAGPVASSTTKTSTGRIDAPWVNSYGWQGYSGQSNFLEFGKRPFMEGENGGIHGHVIYASTRPFDDPQLLLQLSWEPMIPHVKLNLYKEGLAADGVTKTLTLVDHTETSSFDDWAQGFRIDPATGMPMKDISGNYIPNMNCPGQMDKADPFYFGLSAQPEYLDVYENGLANAKTISNDSRYKCYDGMHNWNQLQPAPYDGMYSFPSVTGIDPATGKPAGSGSTNGTTGSLPGTNCTICIANPSKATGDPSDPSFDPFRAGTPMLPDGKYVVEVVIPPGYELVKEEDKNILIGDNFIAPVTQQFAGLGNVFILPDQAEIASKSTANSNPLNTTSSQGRDSSLPSHEGDTGSVETFWPCVGEVRQVPDYISLFPGSAEVAPFAGALRPLCDRKEVTLTDQTSALAKFYLFTETHTASHFTGVITDDFTAEFDPFSPQFGEKFGPAYLPVSFKDWAGNEITRVYSDAWGAYNGLNYSTWEVNPPNPTGYGPTMMVGCMNDAGPINVNGQSVTDPLYQDGYSQFCYELPFMPSQTGYFDTPVVPTSAFAGGYNPPDCAYPDLTPAIAEVDGDGVGPWVGGAAGSGALSAITVTAGGSNYTSTPAVTITRTGTTGSGAVATAVLSASVTNLNLTNAGNGYTSIPKVNLVGGGGTGATARATTTGYVATATVTAGGTGYTTNPTVGFSGGGGSGAAATAVVSGTISSVSINNPGRGYTTAPTVTFSNIGHGGTGAAATANVTGYISAVAITNGGAGSYPSGTPSVTFDPPAAGGVTATGTANMTGSGATRRVSSVTITNQGSGYPFGTSVAVHFSSGTARATGTVRLTVVSVTITNGGSGYTSAPGVSFTNAPFGGTRASGTAHITGAVVAINITSGGSGYTSAPTINITGGGGGSGATATANLLNKLGNLILTAGGSGYTSAPTVQIVPLDGNGTGAAGTSAISGSVVAVVIDNAGSSYGPNAPTIGFTGGGGSGATATASLSNGKLTITALSDQQVDNYEYSGPLATGNFKNLRTKRHYGFGSSSGKVELVDSLGVSHPLTDVSWTDGTITASIPTGVANCGATSTNATGLQQQTQYGGSTAKCGQLVITTAPSAKYPNGQQSIDTVTVTIGGKSPTHVSASSSIQTAIDNAAPGDLIMIDPTCNTTPCTGVSTKTAVAHQEMLLMWKPLRLQGVGAASSVIDANPHPAGRLDPWRREVVCLFGLALNGQPYPRTDLGANNPFDASGTFSCPGNMQYFNGGPNYPNMVVDRIPMEGMLGWDTTVNGNLAEQLIEPSLMGAYEGAGITVLAKGVFIPANSTDVFGSGSEAAFPTNSRPLTSGDCGTGPSGSNQYPSNFLCNPSSIDGLTVKNSSQGGGGIYVHAWAHNLQIANNRILNNQGTMSGGITIGQGEHTDVPLMGGTAATTTVPPGSCIPDTGSPANLALPYCYDLDVNVHHNMVSQNSSLGDELFSSTPAGAGGVTFCNGSDYYHFNYNWVCGNMSTGDGAGVAHVGFSYYGDIEHNTILFNQTTNPSIVTNGGGLLLMGAPDPDPPCATNDQDCVSPANSILPSDGTGPGLLVNANYIVGNSADSGSGGGVRLQHINGTDVVNFRNGNQATAWPNIPGHTPNVQQVFQAKSPWNGVNLINNIISNNVAGWDGGGISLQDAMFTNIVNNSIVSNDTTASSGVLFQTLFAPLASTQGTNCTNNPTHPTQSCPQPAGLVSVTHSAVLTANLPNGITCPAGHAGCISYSAPEMYNDLFWQNRSMIINVGGNAGGLQNQQNMVTVWDPGIGGTAHQLTASQSSTGSCDNGPFSYWDIGVRGNTGPGNTTGGQLSASYSVLTNATEGGSGSHNQHPLSTSAPVASIYCNGSRTPPESGGSNWQVPPGTNESNALPAPPFTLLAGGTVDEGNNWINLSWGPLALSMPDAAKPYSLDPTPQTPAVNNGIGTLPSGTVPDKDFFGNPRGTTGIDIGAIEGGANVTPILTATVAPSTLTFGSQPQSTTSGVQTITVTNTGNQPLTGGTFTFGGGSTQYARATSGAEGGNCTSTLDVGVSCTYGVVFAPAATGSLGRTLTVAYTGATVTPATVTLTGTGTALPNLYVTPAALNFGSVPVGSTGLPAQTLTVHNGTGSTRTLTPAYPAGFQRATVLQGGAGSCGTGATFTLASTGTGNCTINIVFHPSTAGPVSGNFTITSNGGFTVANSPVQLTGTGVTLALNPDAWTPSQTRNCPGTGVLGILACSFDPSQTFTLTNTGTTPVTGVSVGALSGANAADFRITTLGTNCGATVTTLAANGGSCTVTVQFQPLSAEAAGQKTVTLSVTDSAGTQSVTIFGAAN